MTTNSNAKNITTFRHLSPTRPSRRLVLFIGPPKTASTTLETFMYRYASHKKELPDSNPFEPPNTNITAFADWKYPALFANSNTLRCMKDNDPEKKSVLRRFFRNTSQNDQSNVVAGSESMYSTKILRRGGNMDQLLSWTSEGLFEPPEIVIMARNPRMSHLISIWKQQYLQGNKHKLYGDESLFRDFLCLEANTRLVLNRVAKATNPWETALAHMQQRQFRVTIMDMKSVSEDAGMDIAHAFSCWVLGVPCTPDGRWVVGLENVTLHSNTKFADPNISESQLEAMNRAFLERDCAYYAELHNRSLLTILPSPKGLWPDDCRYVASAMGNTYRSNPRTLLNELRRIYQCPSSPTSTLSALLSSTTSPLDGRGVTPHPPPLAESSTTMMIAIEEPCSMTSTTATVKLLSRQSSSSLVMDGSEKQAYYYGMTVGTLFFLMVLYFCRRTTGGTRNRR